MKLAPNTYKPVVGENLLYFMVWSMALLVPILNSKMMSEEHIYLVNILTAWSKLLPYILIFLIHNTLLAPLLLFRKKYILYVAISLTMLVAVFYTLEYYYESIRYLPYASGDLYVIHGRASFTDLAWHWNVLLGIFLFSANCGIKLIFKSMQDEHKMTELERQNLQSEMEALKYQINPHFFMNTLNNIHALIDIDAEAAKTAVIDLSKMMRYVLYDSEREAISLMQDIDFLKNYIDLMRIRYAEQVEITLDYPHELPDRVAIPPLLLIVFVENAFKYGVSYNQRSYIHISIFFADNQLTTIVSNSRPERNEQPISTGIGMENVRKRLELAYGAENYTLNVHEEAQSYTIKLVIPTLNA